MDEGTMITPATIDNTVHLCKRPRVPFKHLAQICFAYIYISIITGMTTMTLTVPSFLEENHNDTVRFLAAKLYESGKVSLGQAAEMAGLSKIAFAEILADHGVNYINYSFDDVMADVARISKG
jgi:predicted HTH domain antitoxin